jgi:hypothetical protein
MFDDVIHRMNEISDRLASGYDGKQSEVQALIHEVRREFLDNFGVIPVWESFELDAADMYAHSNWLRASMAAIHKALQVSQLPDEEYWGGLKYTQPQIEVSKRWLK